MKKHFYITIYFACSLVGALIAPIKTRAQAPVFNWAVQCGSGQGNYGWGPSKTVVDARGNTYAIGSFTGAVLFGNTILTAPGTPTPGQPTPADLFVVKMDVRGNYLWAVQVGGQGPDSVSDFCVDSAGSVYICGYFMGYSVSFGTNGPRLFNSSARSEGYVAKLSGTSRRWLWAKRYGSTAEDYGRAVTVNNQGEVVILATAYGSATDFGSITLAGAVGMKTYWAKADANGNWVWARPLGSGKVLGLRLASDVAGNLYAGGQFYAPGATIGTTALTTRVITGSPSPDGGDVFVAKADNGGNWQWATQGDATNGLNLVQMNDMKHDGGNHLYISGEYESTAVRFGNTSLPNLSSMAPQPSPLPPTPYTNNYYSDSYVARLNAVDGSWLWASRTGGRLNDYSGGIAVNGAGKVYLGGSGVLGAYTGAAFDSPTAPGTLVNLAQLEPTTGAWNWAAATAPLVVCDLAATASGVQLGGYFSTTTAAFGTTTLAGAGPGMDTGYLASMQALVLANQTEASSRATTLTVWPNPTNSEFVWVEGPAPGQAVEVYDVLGQRMGGAAMPASGRLRLAFAVPLAAGVYVVRSSGQARRLVVE